MHAEDVPDYIIIGMEPANGMLSATSGKGVIAQQLQLISPTRKLMPHQLPNIACWARS
jgi:hypothetical protein